MLQKIRDFPMKFTLNWLKDHLDTEASIDELHDALIQLGHEVESIDDPSQTLKDFTIARVVEAKQHPDADKLKVCKVDTGEGVAQVVCGAPNAKTGLVGVFAAPGVYIPGTDFTLGKAKPKKSTSGASNRRCISPTDNSST